MTSDSQLREVLHRVWGFSDFRPLQREAMQAIAPQVADGVYLVPRVIE